MSGKLGKHWLKAAAVINSDAGAGQPDEEAEKNALRGILRGAVHGRGMAVDALNAEGVTLLMLAASKGRAHCIQVLLHEFGAGPGSVPGPDDGSEQGGGCATSASEALRLAIDLDQPQAAAVLLAWSEQNANADQDTQEPEPALDADQMYENMLAKREGRAPRQPTAAAAVSPGKTSAQPVLNASTAREARATKLEGQHQKVAAANVPAGRQQARPATVSPVVGAPIIARGDYEEQVAVLTRFYAHVDPGGKSPGEVRAIVDRRRNAGTPKGTPIPAGPFAELCAKLHAKYGVDPLAMPPSVQGYGAVAAGSAASAGSGRPDAGKSASIPPTDMQQQQRIETGSSAEPTARRRPSRLRLAMPSREERAAALARKLISEIGDGLAHLQLIAGGHWEQQGKGPQMTGEEVVGQLKRSIRAIFQLTAAAGSSQLIIKYRSADSPQGGESRAPEQANAAQVLGLSESVLQALEHCALQQCLADSEEREQRWQQREEETSASKAERHERDIGEAKALLPVLQNAYAALSPTLHEILSNAERMSSNKSTDSTPIGQTPPQHEARSPATVVAKFAGSGNESQGAGEVKQPTTLPPGSKISPAPKVYPWVPSARITENRWVWVLPTEVVDSVSRTPCWHASARSPNQNQVDSRIQNRDAQSNDDGSNDNSIARMERIFGWVRAQNIDLAVDKWKVAEVTRRPEDDGQRDEILAFYRQLVISTSATQVVNNFSIAIYEHAVAAAVLLEDWALFLSHVCGLLNEQYPRLRQSQGKDQRTTALGLRARENEFVGLLLLFFACCGGARDSKESASEITGQLRTMPRHQLHCPEVRYSLRVWEAVRACDYSTYFSPMLWKAATRLQRPFLEFGAKQFLRKATVRRMSKAYNVLPTDFIMQSLGYEGEGRDGQRSDGVDDQPSLAALLAEICPTAMSSSEAEHDPMLAFAAGGHGVLPSLISFKKSGGKASRQQATTRPTSAPTK